MSANPKRISVLLIVFFLFGMANLAAAKTYDCPDTLNVRVQFRPEHPFGVQAESFLNALESIVGPIDTPVVGVPTPATLADSETTGIHAFVGLPSAAFHGSTLVADTFISNLPFYLSVAQHLDWYFNNGGMALEQRIVNRTVGNNEVQAMAVAMSGPEHGLIFKDPIPENLEDAIAYFDGELMRFFGNGGQLMIDVFGISNQVTPGQSPYQLMVDNPVVPLLGADFSTPVGDLYAFFLEPGVSIGNSLNSWECDVTPLGDGPFNPCPNIAQLGYDTLYSQQWHQPYDVQDLFIDADYWRSCLNNSQRNAIQDLGKLNMIVGHGLEILQTPDALDDIESFGVNILGSWPEEVLDELKANARDYFDGRAATDAAFNKVYDSMNRYLEYNP